MKTTARVFCTVLCERLLTRSEDLQPRGDMPVEVCIKLSSMSRQGRRVPERGPEASQSSSLPKQRGGQLKILKLSTTFNAYVFLSYIHLKTILLTVNPPERDTRCSQSSAAHTAKVSRSPSARHILPVSCTNVFQNSMITTYSASTGHSHLEISF